MRRLLIVLAALVSIGMLDFRGINIRGVNYADAEVAACGTDFSSDGNLQWWYKMEEDGASTRVDSSGNGNDLTANGTVVANTTDFKEGSASNESDGQAADELNIADSSLSSAVCTKSGVTCLDVSFGAWIRLTDVGAADHEIFSKGGDLRIVHFGSSTGDVTCVVDVSGSSFASADANPTVDTWYFIACVLDDVADTFKMRLDGVDQVDVETVTVATSSTSNELSVFEGNSTNDFSGMIDEFWMFDRALTDAELDSIMDCGIDGAGLP